MSEVNTDSGKDKGKKGKQKKISLNKQKVELSPFEYISYQNEVGKYTTVGIDRKSVV